MFNVYNWYKLSHILYLSKIPVLPLIIKIAIRLIFTAHIPYQAHIGEGCVLGDAGLGIAIHPRTVIGKSCIIGPHVLIGGTSHKYEVPKIGNKVLIGPGAKILGPITIGDNSVIGANSVVVSDVKQNSLVSGIPAKTIKENIDINDYLQVQILKRKKSKRHWKAGVYIIQVTIFTRAAYFPHLQKQIKQFQSNFVPFKAL